MTGYQQHSYNSRNNTEILLKTKQRKCQGSLVPRLVTATSCVVLWNKIHFCNFVSFMRTFAKFVYAANVGGGRRSEGGGGVRGHRTNGPWRGHHSEKKGESPGDGFGWVFKWPPGVRRHPPTRHNDVGSFCFRYDRCALKHKFNLFRQQKETLKG